VVRKATLSIEVNGVEIEIVIDLRELMTVKTDEAFDVMVKTEDQMQEAPKATVTVTEVAVEADGEVVADDGEDVDGGTKKKKKNNNNQAKKGAGKKKLDAEEGEQGDGADGNAEEDPNAGGHGDTSVSSLWEGGGGSYYPSVCAPSLPDAKKLCQREGIRACPSQRERSPDCYLRCDDVADGGFGEGACSKGEKCHPFVTSCGVVQ